MANPLSSSARESEGHQTCSTGSHQRTPFIVTPPSSFLLERLHNPQHVSWDALTGPLHLLGSPLPPGTRFHLLRGGFQLSAPFALSLVHQLACAAFPRPLQLRLLTTITTYDNPNPPSPWLLFRVRPTFPKVEQYYPPTSIPTKSVKSTR